MLKKMLKHTWNLAVTNKHNSKIILILSFDKIEIS